MARIKKEQQANTNRSAKPKAAARLPARRAPSTMPKASSKASTKSKARGADKKKKGASPPPWPSAHGPPANGAPPTDPNAPKRGLSAYMFFANEQREAVREENPGISFGRVPRPASAARVTDASI